MKLGIDVLKENKTILNELKGKRISLLGHDVAGDRDLNSSLDVLIKQLKLNVVSAFGPQHGFSCDKQDNMVESNDVFHSEFSIPVHSLYGETRKPRDIDIQDFDVCLVDMQDIGCRIYTFITTLLYVMEASAKFKKKVVVLDRPNPVGRNVEGFSLEAAFTSFVGAQPGMMFQHGMSIGEIAGYFKDVNSMDLDLEIVKMQGYDPSNITEHGWPEELPWVNPSPNIPRLSSARVFPGSVLLEGTNLSEGRGTTRPLELWGHPKVLVNELMQDMQNRYPKWLEGAKLRRCSFEPTFHKFTGELCHGFQVHVDGHVYDHEKFKAFRLFALLFKSLRELSSENFAWRDTKYEYETDRLAIDLLCGTESFRQWVDDSEATPEDLEKLLLIEEQAWRETRKPYLLY